MPKIGTHLQPLPKINNFFTLFPHTLSPFNHFYCYLLVPCRTDNFWIGRANELFGELDQLELVDFYPPVPVTQCVIDGVITIRTAGLGRTEYFTYREGDRERKREKEKMGQGDRERGRNRELQRNERIECLYIFLQISSLIKAIL